MASANSNFVNELLEDTFKAISQGAKKIALWGITPETLIIVSALTSGGFASFIAGLIDERPSMPLTEFAGFRVYPPEKAPEIELDTVVITSDQGKERILEQLSQLDSRMPRVIFRGNSNYEFDDSIFFSIVKSCPIKSKAGGYPQMLVHLFQSLKYIVDRNLEGDIAEFGVFQGGTTVFMAKVLEQFSQQKKIYGFDTFAGFPLSKSIMDIYKDTKCEFQDFETVKNYCAPYNIQLIVGDICETYTQLKEIPLALSFFDTDNYSPTRQALELCFEQTVPGGVLAFDHYYSPGWERTVGERIAIKQVLNDKPVFNLYGTGIFIKI